MTAYNHSPLSKTELANSPAANIRLKEQRVDNMSDMTYYQTYEST